MVRGGQPALEGEVLQAGMEGNPMTLKRQGSLCWSQEW